MRHRLQGTDDDCFSLISKFTVSSATQKFIRIVSAELSETGTEYKIQSFNPETQSAVRLR